MRGRVAEPQVVNVTSIDERPTIREQGVKISVAAQRIACHQAGEIPGGGVAPRVEGKVGSPVSSTTSSNTIKITTHGNEERDQTDVTLEQNKFFQGTRTCQVPNCLGQEWS